MPGIARVLAIVLAIVLAATFAAPSAPAAAGELPSLVELRAARLAGDRDRAAEVATELLAAKKRRGDHAAVALALGRIRYEQGRYAEAAAILARATTGSMADMALFYRAESLFWSGEPRRARALLTRLGDNYARSPWVPRARLRVADCLLAERRYTPAVLAYRELLARWPRHPRPDAIVLSLAQALEGKGDRAAAATAYRSVWVRWPTSPLAPWAVTELERLAAMGVDRPPTDAERFVRARALRYLRVHDHSEAELRVFEAEVAARPEAASTAGAAVLWRVRFERALNLLEAGQRVPAVAILEVLNESAPAGLEDRVRSTFHNALARIGRVERLAARYEEEVEAAKTAATKSRARLRAVRLYIGHGRYADALRHLEVLVPTMSKGGEVAWLFAWAKLRDKRWEEARAALASYCAARKGDRERCPYWKARAAERAGHRDEAVAGYAELARRAPFSYYAVLGRSRLAEMGELSPLITPTADSVLDPAEADGPAADEAESADPRPGGPLEASDAPATSTVLAAAPPVVPTGRLVTSDLRAVAEIVGGFEEVDDDFGATAASPTETDDAAFAEAVERYGSAAPGLRRARLLWRIGELASARDELARVFRAYATARGWKTPISVARRGWTDERVAMAAAGVLLWTPVPVAMTTSSMSAAGEGDAAAAPTEGTGTEPTSPAASAPTIPAATIHLGGLDAKFHGVLGRLFVAAGDVHHARKLLGPMADATAEMKLMRFYPRAFRDDVEAAGEAHGVDPAILWAVMHTESAFHPYVTSRAGARGLMQVMPRTGKLIARALGRASFDVDELFDAGTSIEFGAWYLRELLDKFHGQLPIALAAYNGGPRAVERWMDAKADSAPELDEFVEEIPFSESRRYAKKVLSKVSIYRYLYRGARTFEVDCSLDMICEPNIDF